MSDFNNWKEVKKYLEIESNSISFTDPKDSDFTFIFDKTEMLKCYRERPYSQCYCCFKYIEECMIRIIALCGGDPSILHKV